MKTNQTDWIGKKAKVVAAPNQALIGIEGTVVDETQELVTIETSNGPKKVQKHTVTFQIGSEQVAGDHIRVEPAERMKLKVN